MRRVRSRQRQRDTWADRCLDIWRVRTISEGHPICTNLHFSHGMRYTRICSALVGGCHGGVIPFQQYRTGVRWPWCRKMPSMGFLSHLGDAFHGHLVLLRFRLQNFSCFISHTMSTSCFGSYRRCCVQRSISFIVLRRNLYGLQFLDSSGGTITALSKCVSEVILYALRSRIWIAIRILARPL